MVNLLSIVGLLWVLYEYRQLRKQLAKEQDTAKYYRGCVELYRCVADGEVLGSNECLNDNQ